MKDKKENFEEILNNLEEIVDKIESGGLGLEESIRLYEEGMKKALRLEAMLTETREKVMKLVDSGDGKPVLEPFDGEDKA
jgi:exodeoxyribonuclease VII small subunit